MIDTYNRFRRHSADLYRLSILFVLILAVALGSASAQFIYSVTPASELAAYRYQPRTGMLHAVPGSPFTAGKTAASLAADPAGRFVYVTNAGSDDISGYQVDPASGALSPLSRSPFPAGKAPAGIAILPNSKFAYVANSASGDISVYAIDAASGDLTPAARFASGASPTSLISDPAGNFLYVANAGSGSISAFAIDADTGGLTPLEDGRIAAGLKPTALVLASQGKLLYAATEESGGRAVLVFSVRESGGLSLLASAPVLSKGGAFSLAVSPRTGLVYVQSGSEIASYSFDADRTLLTRSSAVRATPGLSAEIAIDGAGRFLYQLNAENAGLAGFSIDSATGALLAGGATASPGSPRSRRTVEPAAALAGPARIAWIDQSAALTGTPLILSFTPGAVRNNYTGGFGLRFTVGSAPLTVTALGRIYIAGNTGSHVVKLVNAADGTDVPGASVTVTLPNGTPGQFTYVALPSPVVLSPNTTYNLISFETAGGDQFYDAGPVIPAPGVTVNSALVYTPMFGFIAVGPQNYSSVPVSFLFTVPNAPPTVSVTTPLPGATLSGTVTLSADAAASPGLNVTSVQFAVDNLVKGTAVSSPYTIQLDTTKLTNGPHIITAIATDSMNNSTPSAGVSITVNNNPTTVQVTSPGSGASVSGTTVPLSASVVPANGLTVNQVQFSIDNGAPVTIKSSPYATTFDSTKLSNGQHSVVAIATDSANNVVPSPTVTFNVNNTASSVTITAPTPNSTVSGNLPVTATATPGHRSYADERGLQDRRRHPIPATSTNPYGIMVDTTKLTNGQHTIQAVATDSGLNTVTSALTVFNVSNGGQPTSGTPLITSFISGPLRNNYTGGLGLEFTVGPAPIAVIALGRFDIAGNTGTHVVKLVNAATGLDVPGGSVTINLAGAPSGQFDYGQLANPVVLAANTSYYLVSSETSGGDQFYDAGSVTPTSAATVNSAIVYGANVGYLSVGPANFGSGPVNLLYVTPGAPPTVALTAPSTGASLSGSNIPVTATASAAPGLTILNVKFLVDNVSIGTSTTTPFGVTLDATKLSNGQHTLTAVAEDSAGSTTTSQPVNFTVNNNPTSVTITAPGAGSTVSGTSVPVSATASAANGATITNVTFTVDNLTPVVVTTSPYSFNLDSTTLSNGIHTVSAVATDSNKTSVNSQVVQFTVNNLASSVAITAPAPGANVSGALAVTAAATPGTGLAINGVSFKVDNAAPVPATSTNPYGFVLDTTTLGNGPHQIVAIATDSGNHTVSSAPLQITVNNNPVVSTGQPLITGFTPGMVRNNYTGAFGTSFTVGSTPINVIALGRIYIAGNSAPHTVKLVNAADGSDVPGGTATVVLPSGAPGQFAYATLPQPITLAANTTYYLVSQEVAGGDQFYNAGPVSATPAVTINSSIVYAPGIGYIPVGPHNYSSGPVNLLYTLATTPPIVSITSPGFGSRRLRDHRALGGSHSRRQPDADRCTVPA